jgi:hypothetical protein
MPVKNEKKGDFQSFLKFSGDFSINNNKKRLPCGEGAPP